MRKPLFRSSWKLLTNAFLAVALAFVWIGCEGTPDSVVGPSSPTTDTGVLGKAQQVVKAVMAVQDRHTDELMAKRGVVGTATGLTEDGRLAVLLLTRGDEDPGAFPLRVDGVPLVIKQVGELFALAATGRSKRPVPIGVSTGNELECSSGTIGCRVTDGTNVYALSNNHVYALENNAPIGSNILQPGPFDTNCQIDPNDIIGQLSDFEQIKFDGSDNTIDAAIAVSSTDKLGNSTPSIGYGTPKSTTVAAFVGQSVQKFGRTTELTKGKVAGVNATVNVGYSSGTARFVDQIIIEGRKPFIKAGDSGSLLVVRGGADDLKPVGLLFAGNLTGKLAVANRIDLVLARFNVTVDDGNDPPPPTNEPPTVAISSPANGSTFDSGVSINFTGSATDPEDGDLTASLTWKSSIDGPIGTGGNFSRNLSDGEHTITAEVTDSDGATGNASVIITVGTPAPAPTLGVSVTTDKVSYVNRENVQITVTVTDGANPVAGVAVHVEVAGANGNKRAGDGTTDGNGVAKFQYKVNSRRDGVGTYTLDATASKAGFNSGSGSTTFEVTE